MGMDDVEPSKSRLKMHFASRYTSFKSARVAMTMGGLRDISESSLQDPRPIILAILGLLDDYPGYSEISVESTGGNAWPDFEAYASVSSTSSTSLPRAAIPDVKFYLTTRNMVLTI
ncbi:hypothetical protein DL764_000148 [Monosporascus ibericus]|uniref:Uncharacterized protein n=1 Tax=Monosporascus ibericus TaxID=155417 RepID=A0A4Q4U014_9PEZI|nr:hypothetical protein DL764_000148 [Monosporascus ibericus]